MRARFGYNSGESPALLVKQHNWKIRHLFRPCKFMEVSNLWGIKIAANNGAWCKCPWRCRKWHSSPEKVMTSNEFAPHYLRMGGEGVQYDHDTSAQSFLLVAVRPQRGRSGHPCCPVRAVTGQALWKQVAYRQNSLMFLQGPLRSPKCFRVRLSLL